MKRPHITTPTASEPAGSAAIAKRRLLAVLAAEKRAQPAAPRADSQLLAQLLAATPKRGH